ncbi:nucleoside-diphosphate-sugar epimerase [Rathayibacter sp. PhB152]|uniref:NAD-dependent epimerase/dehydratase family protein n=1 Tax=Rathayibacter sp. PhB152 TaxID=2485190 RepID=UPI000F4BFCBA|nr:NAD(P)-dependent oxidoreductase [Rathayibacter sp. PhB152]ROQ64156.1 nucleoside-diphosphate-sugar epimerase [Rathayibacter sp. PhB152]
MRIAVTGAAGRLGRSVVAVLSAAGHDVHPLDRVLSDQPRARAVDLLDPLATRELLAALSPDAVIHLAAIAVPFSAPEQEIFTVNTAMAFTVIEAAVSAGARFVLAASSPTVLGYGVAGWTPERLPLDESVPVAPANAYSLSKICVEETIATFARVHEGVRFASFRPCFVVSPEEWRGARTQQGHSILDRLQTPELAAVSLFNYVDARDVGDFADCWLAADSAPSGACYFVGAQDALAARPLAELLPEHLPTTALAAAGLLGTAPAFDSSAAARDTGWTARRSWRTELDSDSLAAVRALEPALSQRTSS